MAFSHPGDGRRSLHGWVVRLIGGKDRYGVVLVLIVVLIVVLASGEEQTGARPGGVGITSAVLLYTLATSGAPRRVFRGLLVALAIVVALAIGGATLFGHTNQSIEDAFMLLLVVVTQVVIARRLISHPYIDRSTVAGALCIYLLVGFCFSTIYRLLPALGLGPFFTTSHASTLDYLWFSYVTLTTVGYGDLIPRGGVGKMLAVTEALMGQIYLVTIVAVLVANIGRPRGSRSRTRSHPRQATGHTGKPRSRARPARPRRRRSPLRS